METRFPTAREQAGENLESPVSCQFSAKDTRGKAGVTEVEKFEEYGADQWFGVWSSVTPSG